MERRQALWGDMIGETLNTYNGTTVQNQNLKGISHGFLASVRSSEQKGERVIAEPRTRP